MTLKEACVYGKEYLESKDVPEAALDAWYLLEYLTGKSRSYYYAHGEEVLGFDQGRVYKELVQKRGNRIPLQHLTGSQEFMGLLFHVNDCVLIPRQDTENLVEEALKTLKPGMQVLDLCTGSGCILISLLSLCPGVYGTGSDVSEEALEVARQNAEENHVNAIFQKSNLFSEIEGVYDCIVSNPPYIATGEIPLLMEEVREHEPLLALDGGEDGLFFYRILAKEAGQYLKEKGWLHLEIGYDQGEAVSALLKDAGFLNVQVKKDLCQNDRVVSAQKR